MGKNIHAVDCVDHYSDELVSINCNLNKGNVALEDVEKWSGLVAKETGQKRRRATVPKKPTYQALKKLTKNLASCTVGSEMSKFNTNVKIL